MLRVAILFVLLAGCTASPSSDDATAARCSGTEYQKDAFVIVATAASPGAQTLMDRAVRTHVRLEWDDGAGRPHLEGKFDSNDCAAFQVPAAAIDIVASYDDGTCEVSGSKQDVNHSGARTVVEIPLGVYACI